MDLVAAAFSPPTDLKLYSLVFDKIAVVELEHHLRLYTKFERPSAVATLRSLMTRGVLIDPGREDSVTFVDDNALEDLERLTRSLNALGHAPTYHRIRDQAGDISARLLAARLRKTRRMNAVALTSRWQMDIDMAATRTEVIHLVMKALPIPGEGHSYDDILDFREEARSSGLTQSLRLWMSEMASGRLSQLEVSEKLEDLVSRYERALALERMSRTDGVIETLITTSAEIAESLVKFKWAEVAKRLFQVRHRQIDLMKAEMALPGREVAYIVKARERFGT